MSRTALVTGAGSGLGRSISVKLATDGHRVALVDVSLESAEKVAAEIQAVGGEALPVIADVSDEAAVESAFTTVRSTSGRSKFWSPAQRSRVSRVSTRSPSTSGTATWRSISQARSYAPARH